MHRARRGESADGGRGECEHEKQSERQPALEIHPRSEGRRHRKRNSRRSGVTAGIVGNEVFRDGLRNCDRSCVGFVIFRDLRLQRCCRFSRGIACLLDAGAKRDFAGADLGVRKIELAAIADGHRLLARRPAELNQRLRTGIKTGFELREHGLQSTEFNVA